MDDKKASILKLIKPVDDPRIPRPTCAKEAFEIMEKTREHLKKYPPPEDPFERWR